MAQTTDRHRHGCDDWPDFIIAGGMKCGTSTLHRILNNHPDVSMPDGEQYLLDFDDRSVHPNFPDPPARVRDQEDLSRYVLNGYREKLDARFRTGERSTTYLYSRLAVERMCRFFPGVKVIVLLRDPVERAYSHYWHNVRTGRVTKSFEKCIRSPGANLLHRGRYTKYLQRYRTALPDEQLKTVLFERFIDEMGAVLDEVFHFLDIPVPDDPGALIETGNVGRVPLHIPLQLKLNKISRRLAPFRYEGVIPGSRQNEFKLLLSLIDRGVRRLLNVRWRSKPEMSSEIRLYLQDFYRSKNNGLTDLTDAPISEYWSYWS